MRRTDPQRGQVLPVVLATLALAAAAIAVSHRVARGVAQESAVVNAADAAAYSGAAWTARRLNLIAYTNRALIANHIAVGHAVAYISWLRYTDDAVEQIERYARFIPYVGPAVSQAERLLSKATKVSAHTTGLYIRGTDAYLDILTTTQYDARIGLRKGKVDEAMRRVVHRHDEQFKINDADAIDAIPAPYEAGMDARLFAERFSSYLALDSVGPGKDDGYFQRLLSATIDRDRGLSRWLRGPARRGRPRYGRGGRKWNHSVFHTVRFRKQGVTQQPPLPDAGGWRSGDRLQVSFFNPAKFSWGSWATLASGRASADGLGGNYRGVSKYTRLENPPADKKLLRIPALVTAPLPGADDADDANAVNAHLSIGEVRYRVPDNCGRYCPARHRPATLFNPYWEAALSEPQLPRLP
ncbi:hypothetical protein [Spiribacter vilamensis]|uniref:Uncharacterized protein n=1 Tax=Spiribacter vilamensis TaxID=531306 RepID=A0A4Q8D0A2_9GAMM|nr:hypothetical protein [Spiribacter vilamensis]RZU98640.1 hypothetical protein EV698_0895 [Spiribacter vilamensis]TVO60102.1 hypothetical protein FPL09_09720 [Spiribacter vilamensis]